MNNKDLYNILRFVLNKSQFIFDNRDSTISIKIPMDSSFIDGLEEAIKAIIGQEIRPRTSSMPTGWRIKPDLILTDEKTIKYDKYGRLYVDIDEIRKLAYIPEPDIEEDQEEIKEGHKKCKKPWLCKLKRKCPYYYPWEKNKPSDEEVADAEDEDGSSGDVLDDTDLIDQPTP